MPGPCRIALIGQKFMGKAHANAWTQAPHHFTLPRRPVLQVVAGRDANELKAFAERWSIADTTTRWQSLMERDDVDLVDVCTPNHLHAECSIAALEAGKHVACEKPLAATLDEARAMRDAARAAPRGTKTFVWFNYRRCPAVGLAHRLVKEGRLGRIFHVRATYLQSWGGPATPMSWRFRKKQAGSGAHGDLNAHIVDLCRFVTGDEISEVHGAVARTFVKARIDASTGQSRRCDVDDAVSFLASLRGGATASFEATRVAPGHLNRNTLEINGERGSLRFDFEDMNVLHFIDAEDGPREGGWRRIMCTAAGQHPYLEAWWPDAHVLGYEHGFVNQAADIVRSLSKQPPELPLPDFADAYETQRVLEAAMIAAREGAQVKLSQVQ
ncbi:MAG: Gfo/Idh/MocA family oxidoreductase [Planctomycetes bacterium]|nr:Gfo/Idh/MocA family oxidoreductase [Planctomycetota bacterium]